MWGIVGERDVRRLHVGGAIARGVDKQFSVQIVADFSTHTLKYSGEEVNVFFHTIKMPVKGVLPVLPPPPPKPIAHQEQRTEDKVHVNYVL